MSGYHRTIGGEPQHTKQKLDKPEKLSSHTKQTKKLKRVSSCIIKDDASKYYKSADMPSQTVTVTIDEEPVEKCRLTKECKENCTKTKGLWQTKVKRRVCHKVKRRVCHNVKRRVCHNVKRRSCRQMAIVQMDMKDKTEQRISIISQFVKTHNGVVINSSDPNVISCYKGGKCCQSVKCCSLVTDMTRVETDDKAMATLSYSKQIIITGSMGCQVLNIHKGYRRISHVGGSTFVGSCMYSRKLYVVDWKKKFQTGIIHEFDIKDSPSDIAVGPRQHILTTFAYINCVACYNLKGDTLFKLNSVSGLPLNMPSRIFADCRFFYFIESDKRQINRVSAVGGVSQVKIPIVADNMAIDKNTMVLWNSSAQGCILETGKHFWPNEVYFHQAQTPTIDRHVYINNATHVKDILMVSDSRVILVNWDRQIVLINGDDIDQSLVDSVELDGEPTAICQWNETQILVCFSETIQFISWEGDKLEKKSELETTVGYVQVSNKASNEVAGLTVSPQLKYT